MRNPHSPPEFKFTTSYRDAGTPQDAVARAMEGALRAAGVGGHALGLSVDTAGATSERLA